MLPAYGRREDAAAPAIQSLAVLDQVTQERGALQPRAIAHQNQLALRPRQRHVEPASVRQEVVPAAPCSRGWRAAEREQDHAPLRPLEAVNRVNRHACLAGLRQSLADRRYLRAVGRDHANLLGGYASTSQRQGERA